MEVKEFDQYVLKIDGSGRLTLRNRKFLRKITPYQLTKHFKSDNPVPLTPVTSPTSEPPEVPTEAPPAPSPSSSPPVEPRRSTRVKKETDRLVDKMRFGGKSYDDTSTSSIDYSLCHCRPSGGGGVTGHALARTGEKQPVLHPSPYLNQIIPSSRLQQTTSRRAATTTS